MYIVRLYKILTCKVNHLMFYRLIAPKRSLQTSIGPLEKERKPINHRYNCNVVIYCYEGIGLFCCSWLHCLMVVFYPFLDLHTLPYVSYLFI